MYRTTCSICILTSVARGMTQLPVCTEESGVDDVNNAVCFVQCQYPCTVWLFGFAVGHNMTRSQHLHVNRNFERPAMGEGSCIPSSGVSPTAACSLQDGNKSSFRHSVSGTRTLVQAQMHVDTRPDMRKCRLRNPAMAVTAGCGLFMTKR